MQNENAGLKKLNEIIDAFPTFPGGNGRWPGLRVKVGTFDTYRLVNDLARDPEYIMVKGVKGSTARRVYWSINKKTGEIKQSTEYRVNESTSRLLHLLLTELIEDPVATLDRHGKEKLFCCFCGSPLKREESTSHGYGPVCARKFNLPWGLN